MTPDRAISIAESERWTVVGTSQRSDTTTLYLRTPLGRSFQLTVYPEWTEETVREKLAQIKIAPF